MRILSLLIASALLFSCENTIEASYKSLETKNLQLRGEDGKLYKISVVKDSSGQAQVKAEEISPQK